MRRENAALAALTALALLASIGAGAAAVEGATNAHGLAIVHNPLADDAAAIAEGEALFAEKACSGCHGSAGAGGMCPSLVNAAWTYGNDDTTLFNLIRLGSAGLRAHGYVRSGEETIVADMPPLGSVVSDEEAWQLIAWIRSRYAGAPTQQP